MRYPLARRLGHPLTSESFNHFLNEAFSNFLSPSEHEPTNTSSWMPAVDIKETDDALVLVAELPGMKKNEVNITLENQVLTLAGERTFERDEAKENYHRVERAYGTFSRSFSLPKNINAAEVNATFNSGVLTVSIPKAPEAKPHKITIK